MRYDSNLLAVFLFCCFATAANAELKDDVRSSIKKLEESANYTWSTTVRDLWDGNLTIRDAIDGRVRSDGYASVAVPVPDKKDRLLVYYNIRKYKFAFYKDENWISAKEAAKLASGDPQVALCLTAPDLALSMDQIRATLDVAGDVKKSDSIYEAELTGAQIHQLLETRVPPSSQKNSPPVYVHAVDCESGTVRYWTKDGILIKMEIHLVGTVYFDSKQSGNLERKITTDFIKVGTSTVDVPEKVIAVLP